MRYSNFIVAPPGGIQGGITHVKHTNATVNVVQILLNIKMIVKTIIFTHDSVTNEVPSVKKQRPVWSCKHFQEQIQCI